MEDLPNTRPSTIKPVFPTDQTPDLTPGVQRGRMIRGEFYYPGDPELCKDRAKARRLMRQINNEDERDKRQALIKSLFGSTGPEIYMEVHVKFSISSPLPP